MIDEFLCALPSILDSINNRINRIASDQSSDGDRHLRKIWTAVREISDSDKQQAEIIEQICRELQGLSPHNLNPRIEEIHEWMRQHVEYEQQIQRKQQYWNTTLAIGAGLALFLSILSLLK